MDQTEQQVTQHNNAQHIWLKMFVCSSACYDFICCYDAHRRESAYIYIYMACCVLRALIDLFVVTPTPASEITDPIKTI